MSVKRNNILSKVASLTGYSYEHCRRVSKKISENEEISYAIMLFEEGEKQAIKKYHMKYPKTKFSAKTLTKNVQTRDL